MNWRESGKRTWEGLEGGERGSYVTIFSFLKTANNKVVTGNFPQPRIGCSSFSSPSYQGQGQNVEYFHGIHSVKEFSTGAKYSSRITCYGQVAKHPHAFKIIRALHSVLSGRCKSCKQRVQRP